MDLPEGLPVPTVSSPSTVIPAWNVLSEGYLVKVLEFADAFLHDDAALVLIHCADPRLCTEIVEWSTAYDFEVFRDWWGVNDLRLTSPTDPTKMVCGIFFSLLTFFIISSHVLYGWINSPILCRLADSG